MPPNLVLYLYSLCIRQTKHHTTEAVQIQNHNPERELSQGSVYIKCFICILIFRLLFQRVQPIQHLNSGMSYI